jgi:chemotaxis protein CheD
MAPYWDRKKPASNAYGDIAIKALIDSMLEIGCTKSNLQAKVFGGGEVLNIQNDFLNVSKANVEVANEQLKKHNVPIVSSSVGGIYGRKLRFNTKSGHVYVKRVNSIAGRVLSSSAA